jgi:cytidylate kinase
VPTLVEKLKRKEGAPVNVILVSGIPGSGKGRLSNSIARHLNQEKVNAHAFKMPTVQQNVKYETESFTQSLLEFISEREKEKP